MALPLVDKILDAAGQKGTGKWTAIDALNMGMPLTLIGEAVFARCLSSMVEERQEASKLLSGTITPIAMKQEECVNALEQALYASKIISYAQGFLLMRQAALEYGWKLNFGAIALMWRGGCIIRSAFLGKIKEAYDQNPNLQSLILAPYFVQELQKALGGWRKIASLSFESGIPIPCIATALAFFDGYRSAKLPANLIQAQRDFFGAHTYERIDRPRGEFIHSNWSEG